MTDRPYSAANRKDIRAAEKVQIQIATINREVIAGLMSVANGRHWVYSQLADAFVFADPFSPDPPTLAYNTGLRSAGIRLFNDLILYAPDNFTTMLKEAHERAIILDRVRNTVDRVDPADEPGFDFPAEFGSDIDGEAQRTQ